MVESGHCLQQMQRKEGQQNSQAAGVETEKDSVGEQASAMCVCPTIFSADSAHHFSLHKHWLHGAGTISMAGGSVGGHGARR